MSLSGTASEVAEQLVLLYPVHLRGLLLLFGMDLHLLLRRRSAEAHLSEGVRHPAAFFIRQLGNIGDSGDIFFQTQIPKAPPGKTAWTHLCAGSAAAEGGVCGGAAVQARAGGAVRY